MLRLSVLQVKNILQRIHQVASPPVDRVYERAVFIPAPPEANLAIGIAKSMLAHLAVAIPPGAGAIKLVFK